MTATGPLVLVVEDELAMRRFLRASFGAQGYRMLEAETLAEARVIATTHNPDLIILDLGLPDGDGVAFTRELREWSHVPIIVVSARGRESDKVDALDAGADDYLTKPFAVGELLARVRVALRHARLAAGASEPVLVVGPLKLDLPGHVAWLDGQELKLTPTEWRLLALLATHAGKVLTHRQILKEVWGPNQVEHTHYVRVYMAELRKKLEPDPTRPRLLVTEPGVGYRLRDS
ncbi:MAG: response regulator [Myxococcota bacterium]